MLDLGAKYAIILKGKERDLGEKDAGAGEKRGVPDSCKRR